MKKATNWWLFLHATDAKIYRLNMLMRRLRARLS